ncbi:ATP-binding cassette domain-containing protein [Lactobacillus kefiranofaciens]|uniref:ABC transporter ATP-binding protein n=1 Tax=Lactobacillus kefiranofaciens TaxID=267818 RepID=A0AAX3UFN0_9LACO|nr:ABC transporter ATP-binding protein [Lactobacillus kefiranofaciens]AEG40344.1 ABC transporter [Lactobacillus kefiranofaciens subsp. kefiranofaciens]QFQ67893.1 ABC transporter ATP-binding protein [Lactobacillus kefiranofaciens subsp. kefiranofaciens]WGO86338.1 ABC transporter ATP-binding protein [Lactobacillus kefiranofaciens]WQH36342.1 ABC transporter ATP-binding protein [Lactobacillus kefiranofaciens]SDA55287.1 ABC-type bacteriocin/lantibiotic exporter, contains an N-terminal double-glycin
MNIKGIFNSNKGRFILIFLMVVIGMVLDSGSQYLMTPAFNNLKKMDLVSFIIFLSLSRGCDLVRLALVTGSDYLYGKQTQSYLHQIRGKISRYFFNNEIDQPAKVQNEMVANLDQLTNKYLKPIKDGFMYLLVVVFSIGILFSFNWLLVVMTLILTVISLFLPKTFEKMTSSATVTVTKKNEKFLDTLAKWMSGLDELRRYASFGIFSSSINQSAKQYKRAAIHQGATIAIADMITFVVNIAGQIMLMILCAYLYFHGQIVFGAVITTIQFSSSVMNGVSLFVTEWNSIKSTKGLNKEIANLQAPVEIASDQHVTEKLAKVEVKNLALKFKNGEQISYPDFDIKQGEKILLTGDSGTGKSTLFKLVLGKLKPTQGEINFLDKNGNSLTLNRDELGYIAQDNTLFPDTINENVTMFDNSLAKQVPDVLNKVDLKNDVQRMPDGLNSQVDLDKGNLSGGQRQKIILARALIHHKPWLFIDEGTSAIDSEGTKKVLQNLLKTKSTVIMIAHNYSNELISMFDRQIKLTNEGEDE